LKIINEKSGEENKNGIKKKVIGKMKLDASALN